MPENRSSAVDTPPLLRARVSNRALKLCGVVAAIVLTTGIALLWAYWPFSAKTVVSELQDVSQSKVQFGSFHRTYFPNLGCVLENVKFVHNPRLDATPLITIEKLQIEGSLFGLFTHHLKRIRVEGLRIRVPAQGTGENFQTPPRSTIVIDDLVADGARLEFATRSPRERPLVFSFQKFRLDEIGGRGPASFRADFSNPDPPGHIVAGGKFGPWNQADVGQTPVSGEYSFQHADLGVYGGISGFLASTGEFNGMLNHIGVRGASDVPDFEVSTGKHPAEIRSEFQAVVDATNGDTFLQSITARFWKTTLFSDGKVTGSSGNDGKTALIDLATNNGRIEDLLRLFTSSTRPSMSGAVSFQANVRLPAGDRSFLKKLVMHGNFGIDEGRFLRPATQMAVKTLSDGAQGLKIKPDNERDGQDAGDLLSNLKGHVTVKEGTAHFSDLSFSVPGAFAQMQGTFNLISQKIDLHGTLRTNSELSKTTRGAKAVILKVLDPLFKKHQSEYVAPVKITGTYQHPSFGLDLIGPKKPKAK